MALKQTIRLTLVDKQPYAIQSKNDPAKIYKGFIYTGLDKNSKPFNFTTIKDEYPVVDSGRYEETLARDITLFGRVDNFTGATKWANYEREKKDLTRIENNPF